MCTYASQEYNVSKIAVKQYRRVKTKSGFEKWTQCGNTFFLMISMRELFWLQYNFLLHRNCGLVSSHNEYIHIYIWFDKSCLMSENIQMLCLITLFFHCWKKAVRTGIQIYLRLQWLMPNVSEYTSRTECNGLV